MSERDQGKEASPSLRSNYGDDALQQLLLFASYQRGPSLDLLTVDNVTIQTWRDHAK